MNVMECLETSYLNRASRSVDTMLLTNEKEEKKVLYVQNFEGISFKVFDALMDLVNYLYDDSGRTIAEFDTDEELDNYLINYEIIGY